MQYWLIKSEPHTWSWHDQETKKVTPWDGVRNYQANTYMKAMCIGDLSFFYHSGIERQIMGIVRVILPFYGNLDPAPFGRVDVEFVESLSKPITLRSIKEDPRLQTLPLVRQSRLSVMPIPDLEWRYLCEKGGKSS